MNFITFINAMIIYHSYKTWKSAGDVCGESAECILADSCPGMLVDPRVYTSSPNQNIQGAVCGYDDDESMKVCCSLSTITTRTKTRTLSTTTPKTSPKVNYRGESLLSENCGQTINADRILGGTEAPLGGNPWMAALGYNDTSDSNPTSEVIWACGGSLINNRYILTAAHCVDSHHTKEKVLTTIRLGEHNFLHEKDCEGKGNGRIVCAPKPKNFSPMVVIIHEDYNYVTLKQDIALIKLDKEVEHSSYIQPVCLPTYGVSMSKLLEGEEDIKVSGWGITETGARSDALMEVYLPVVELGTCNTTHRLVQDKSQICLGGEHRIDSCVGDSGGPGIVTSRNDTNRFTQVVLVSYGGLTCGTKGVPAVYTDVNFFREWIVGNLWP